VPLGSPSAILPAAALAFPRWLASAESNLQETNALLWVIIGIATAGSIVTFAFLVYTLWKFRDPNMRDRRYG